MHPGEAPAPPRRVFSLLRSSRRGPPAAGPSPLGGGNVVPPPLDGGRKICPPPSDGGGCQKNSPPIRGGGQKFSVVPPHLDRFSPHLSTFPPHNGGRIPKFSSPPILCGGAANFAPPINGRGIPKIPPPTSRPMGGGTKSNPPLPLAPWGGCPPMRRLTRCLVGTSTRSNAAQQSQDPIRFFSKNFGPKVLTFRY